MTILSSALVGAGMLDIDIRSYMPLIIMFAILAAVFILFRIFRVSTKLLWSLLINGLLGALMLFVFNMMLSDAMGMHFFEIPITWTSAVVAGVLGVPGIILLLLLKIML